MSKLRSLDTAPEIKRQNPKPKLLWLRPSLQPVPSCLSPYFGLERAGVTVRIAGAIRGQYTLGYASSNPAKDGSYHQVKITAVGQPLSGSAIDGESRNPCAVTMIEPKVTPHSGRVPGSCSKGEQT